MSKKKAILKSRKSSQNSLFADTTEEIDKIEYFDLAQEQNYSPNLQQNLDDEYQQTERVRLLKQPMKTKKGSKVSKIIPVRQQLLPNKFASLPPQLNNTIPPPPLNPTLLKSINNFKFKLKKKPIKDVLTELFELSSEKLAGLNVSDMNGVENLTDFDIYRISKLIPIDRLEGIRLNACRNITIWSMVYLSNLTATDKAKKRVNNYFKFTLITN